MGRALTGVLFLCYFYIVRLFSPPVLFLAAAGGLLAADYAAEGNLWWSHVQFLADDRLEGRNTGSPGFQKAVQYVETQFEKLGLKPAGVSGYLQPVQFETRQMTDSTVDIVRDGQTEPVVARQEATLTSRGDVAASVDAPMVFVGYGMSIPEAHYDDLAGLDLKGKIAIYINAAGPVNASGNVKSHYASGAERWAALKRAGAIGTAMLPNPRPNAPTPDGAQQGGAGRGAPPPSFVLAEPSLQESAGQKVALTITRRGAAKFLAGSGHTYEELEALAIDNQLLPKFPLMGTLHTRATVKRDSVEAPNIVGLFPGADPRLKNQYVIMSAHLDHVGVGRPVNDDTIYNGAMDDASGIASILEIARILKTTGAKPKRSILFLAVTAEEKGELGSRYFAAHPTVPAASIVADFTLDQFLPLYPLKVIEVQGLTESSLGDEVRAAARSLGVDVQTDREPEQNRFIRSDQYSFIRNGIPSLAFKFGYEAGSPDEKIRREWVRDRYHKPSDDLSQPVDQAAAALFNHVIANLIERVADDPARPHWNSDSFFKRFAQ
jgi:Zn-dependent M28 family amino/carboxypeptidase